MNIKKLLIVLAMIILIATPVAFADELRYNTLTDHPNITDSTVVASNEFNLWIFGGDTNRTFWGERHMLASNQLYPGITSDSLLTTWEINITNITGSPQNHDFIYDIYLCPYAGSLNPGIEDNLEVYSPANGLVDCSVPGTQVADSINFSSVLGSSEGLVNVSFNLSNFSVRAGDTIEVAIVKNSFSPSALNDATDAWFFEYRNVVPWSGDFFDTTQTISQMNNSVGDQISVLGFPMGKFYGIDFVFIDNDADGSDSTVDCDDSDSSLYGVANLSTNTINTSVTLCSGSGDIYNNVKFLLANDNISINLNGTSFIGTTGTFMTYSSRDNVTMANGTSSGYATSISLTASDLNTFNNLNLSDPMILVSSNNNTFTDIDFTQAGFTYSASHNNSMTNINMTTSAVTDFISLTSAHDNTFRTFNVTTDFGFAATNVFSLTTSNSNTIQDTHISTCGLLGIEVSASDSNILRNISTTSSCIGIIQFVSGSNLNIVNDSNLSVTPVSIWISTGSNDNNTFYNNILGGMLDNNVTLNINNWNVSTFAGTNIIGGPNIGGNSWVRNPNAVGIQLNTQPYAGFDLTGDGFGNTILPHKSVGSLPTFVGSNTAVIRSGGDYFPLTPEIEIVSLTTNSTQFGAPTSGIINITGWNTRDILSVNFTITDPNGFIHVNNLNGTEQSTASNTLWNSSIFTLNESGQWNITVSALNNASISDSAELLFNVTDVVTVIPNKLQFAIANATNITKNITITTDSSFPVAYNATIDLDTNITVSCTPNPVMATNDSSDSECFFNTSSLSVSGNYTGNITYTRLLDGTTYVVDLNISVTSEAVSNVIVVNATDTFLAIGEDDESFTVAWLINNTGDGGAINIVPTLQTNSDTACTLNSFLTGNPTGFSLAPNVSQLLQISINKPIAGSHICYLKLTMTDSASAATVTYDTGNPLVLMTITPASGTGGGSGPSPPPTILIQPDNVTPSTFGDGICQPNETILSSPQDCAITSAQLTQSTFVRLISLFALAFIGFIMLSKPDGDKR